MAKLTSDITDSTLLCERCGYVLEGLDEGGACPECGKRIAESLPGRRVGTPWQRRRSIGSWCRTFARVIRQPVLTVADARIERMGMRRLTCLNVMFAGALLAFGWSKTLWAAQVRFGSHVSGWYEVVLTAALVMCLMLMPAFAVGMFVMTWIEVRGVRFFGGRRGWRISPEVAWAVCGHMSFWWVLGAATTLAVALLMPAQSPDWDIVVYLFKKGYPPDLDIRLVIASVVFFAAGLLPFECTVFLGVRRCRFANRPIESPSPRSA